MVPSLPHEVVLRLYDLISGPAEQERNWEAVQDLFHPEAVLRSELTLPDGTHQSGRWTPAEFAAAGAEEYRKDGFWEREVARRVEEYGNVAHVWSTYEARVGSLDAPPAIRGINSVQLLRKGGRWWITGLVFQVESGAGDIPSS
jgi:hypothetical protein